MQQEKKVLQLFLTEAKNLGWEVHNVGLILQNGWNNSV